MDLVTLLLLAQAIAVLWTAPMFKILKRDGREPLRNVSQEPTDDIRESLYEVRICESDQRKIVLSMYQQEIKIIRRRTIRG